MEIFFAKKKREKEMKGGGGSGKWWNTSIINLLQQGMSSLCLSLFVSWKRDCDSLSFQRSILDGEWNWRAKIFRLTFGESSSRNAGVRARAVWRTLHTRQILVARALFISILRSIRHVLKKSSPATAIYSNERSFGRSTASMSLCEGGERCRFRSHPSFVFFFFFICSI